MIFVGLVGTIVSGHLLTLMSWYKPNRGKLELKLDTQKIVAITTLLENISILNEILLESFPEVPGADIGSAVRLGFALDVVVKCLACALRTFA